MGWGVARDRVLNYMTRRLGQTLWAGGVRHPFTLVCFLRTLAVVLHSLSHSLSLASPCRVYFLYYITLYLLFIFDSCFYCGSAVGSRRWQRLKFVISLVCNLLTTIRYPSVASSPLWPAPLTYPGQTHTHTSTHTTHPQHVRTVPPPARRFLERLL